MTMPYVPEGHPEPVLAKPAPIVERGRRKEPIKIPGARKLAGGVEHGLEPVVAPHVHQIMHPSAMLYAMRNMTTGARALGIAADVLEAMARDKDCRVVLTLSGIATIGQLGNIFSDMIDRKLIHAVVASGAVVTHSISSEIGGHFFKINPETADDVKLYNRGYNRTDDTLELEKSLVSVGKLVERVAKEWDAETPISSMDLNRKIGVILCKEYQKFDGLLHACARNRVPIFVPAFSDSEIGLAFAKYLHDHRNSGRPFTQFDAFKDWGQFCTFVAMAPKRGILTLGGGVPRNWAQQVGPYFDELKIARPIRYGYGVRICDAAVTNGSLSGCTYSEGVTWGKFIPPDEGGQFAEVPSDYTLVFPLLVAGLFERLGLK